MRLKSILYFFLILVYQINYAQYIRVVDSFSNSHIAYATIELKDIKQNKKYIYQTDSAGSVVINLSDKNSCRYSIVVLALGYATFSDTLYCPFDTLILSLKKTDHQLDEIVITGEPVPIEKEKSVYQIKIISEEKIKAMAAQNLRDVLTNQAYMRINQDNILGSSVNMLGLSGQAIKIMIDGVPVIGRLNGNIDLSQINMNSVERIEIIEGPMAVKYGTDAMGGVINIITKKSSSQKLISKTMLYYESNGTYNSNTTLLISHKKHQLNVNVGRNFFDGWRPDEKKFHFEKVKIADSTRYKIWKPKEQYFGFITDNIQLKKSQLILNADYFFETIEDKGKPKLPYYESAFDNFYKTFRNNQKIQFNSSVSKTGNIDIIASRNYFKRIKNSYYNDLTSLEKTLTTNTGDQDTSIFQMYMSRGVFSNKLFRNIYEVGYDVYTESALSSIIQNKKQRQTDMAMFLSYNIELKNKLKVKPSLRASYNSLYSTPIIPSVHFLYTFNNKTRNESQHTSNIRLSYSKGFRTPSLKELFLNFVDINHNIIGNSSLKPELSDFFNGAFNYNYFSSNTKIKTTFSVFYNHVYNLIQLAQVNSAINQYSYVNISEINTMGTNLNFNYEYKNIQSNITLAYTGLNYPNIKSSEKLFYPEVILNLSYNIKSLSSQINLFSKYNGKLPYYSINGSDDSNYQINYSKDYFQIDINYSFTFFKERMNVAIGIKNLMNNTFLNFSSGGAHSSGGMYISTGRTYFVQCTLNLKK
ncbi:MAG: TonB-dependent receptor [Bacteroidia bacterium]|nr:MAG: TonB-dependent receptor [Bacteroidia bacterium]